jgi:hypothetical protein
LHGEGGMEMNERKAGRKGQRSRYERPQLRKRERLSEVAEGAPPPVTDGELEKGGCFRRGKP